MASRNEKLRRRQHRKDKKRRRARGPSSEFAHAEHLVVVNPRGAAKMSEVLLELVEPEWNLCQDKEAIQRLLTLGVAAWNAALMKGAERIAFLENLAQTFPVEMRPEFQQVIEPFIRRKEELFPHIQRPIFSFELTGTSRNPHLTVLSGLA